MVDHLNLAIDMYLEIPPVSSKIKRRYQQPELLMIMMPSTATPAWSLLVTADRMPTSMRTAWKSLRPRAVGNSCAYRQHLCWIYNYDQDVAVNIQG